jgi:hypothetical protein
MAHQPGFIDQGGGCEVQADPMPEPDIAVTSATLPTNPVLLELPEGASTSMDRIDPAWAPKTIKPARVRTGSLSWLVGGIALVLLGWICLSGVAFLHDQFARSVTLGVLTLRTFVVGARTAGRAG